VVDGDICILQVAPVSWWEKGKEDGAVATKKGRAGEATAAGKATN
jgi:hypothetical protein